MSHRSVEDKISFMDWKTEFYSTGNNHYLYDPIFASELGCRLIDILDAADLVKKVLKRSSWKDSKYVIQVADTTILEKLGKKLYMSYHLNHLWL
jgi:predicted DNA binding protein